MVYVGIAVVLHAGIIQVYLQGMFAGETERDRRIQGDRASAVGMVERVGKIPPVQGKVYRPDQFFPVSRFCIRPQRFTDSQIISQCCGSVSGQDRIKIIEGIADIESGLREDQRIDQAAHGGSKVLISLRRVVAVQQLEVGLQTNRMLNIIAINKKIRRKIPLPTSCTGRGKWVSGVLE